MAQILMGRVWSVCFSLNYPHMFVVELCINYVPVDMRKID